MGKFGAWHVHLFSLYNTAKSMDAERISPYQLKLFLYPDYAICLK